MTVGNNDPRGRIFYGWYVVAAVFITMMTASGLGFYNLSVYLNAFVAQGGFSVSATSGATACFFVASGLCGMGVAYFIERFDPRWSISFGALLCAGVVLGAGHVTELWQLYLFYALFGTGYAFCGLIPGTTLVARWFARRRSIALSVASTGLSVGGIVLTPLSAWMIDELGFVGATPWIAAIFLIGVLPVAWALIRPYPSAFGVGPDGDPIVRNADGSDVAFDGLAYLEAIRSRFFIFCCGAYIFAMGAQVGGIAHQFRLVDVRTGNDETAALAVAVMAASSIVGRLFGGWLLTRVPSRPFVMVLLLVQAAALTAYATFSSEAGLLLAASLFGVTVGNLLMMQPLILAEAFGLKAYARIYSLSQLLTMVGVAFGPALVGVLYEFGEGYLTGYLAIACGSLVAFALFTLTGPVSAPLDARNTPLAPAASSD